MKTLFLTTTTEIHQDTIAYVFAQNLAGAAQRRRP